MAAVRQLGAGDIAGFRAMNALFADVFAMPEEYLGNPPSDDYVAAWLAERRNIAIVAETDGEVVGAIGGYEWPKYEQARSELYIYDLAVSERHRRQGIASAMIGQMRRIAREVGAWTVIVQADVFEEDEPARALYRKFASEEIMAHHFDIKP
jgi:aminoglycoside 3-N-acetyltransferase I